MEGRMKEALTHNYERLAHGRIMADFLRAVEMITPEKAEEVRAEKGDIEKPARIKMIRCAKCGIERPESEYDCHTINCNYGGD